MEVSNMTIKEALKEYFGFDSFKGNQEEIIESLLAGKDTLVLMPTGGGKSLCYQLPALMLEGTAIIVSPLIALMKNQVDLVRSYSSNNDIAHFLNSSLNRQMVKKVKADITEGRTKMLYVRDTLVLDPAAFVSVTRPVEESYVISVAGRDTEPVILDVTLNDVVRPALSIVVVDALVLVTPPFVDFSVTFATPPHMSYSKVLVGNVLPPTAAAGPV